MEFLQKRTPGYYFRSNSKTDTIPSPKNENNDLSNSNEMEISNILEKENSMPTYPPTKEAYDDGFTHMLTENLFPVIKPYYDTPGITIPFSKLKGEHELFIGNSKDDVIIITNFRLFILRPESFLNIPLKMIESLERVEIVLHITTKDGRSTRYAYDSVVLVATWYQRLIQVLTGRHYANCEKNNKLANEKPPLFPFYFWSFWNDTKLINSLEKTHQEMKAPFQCIGKEGVNLIEEDYKRQGITTEKIAWRISNINLSYKICESYPQIIVLPRKISDDIIRDAANFRGMRRFPAVVWRHPKNGAVICRSAQPQVGFFNWRNTQDEAILSAVSECCKIDSNEINGSQVQLSPEVDKSTHPRLCVFDCRSYISAIANKGKGGGTEYAEYYTCDIEHLNLSNIHQIRKSFAQLTNIIASPDQQNWLSLLDNTKWLTHLSSLLKAATIVARHIHLKACPALVHCSDGWDRTSQVTALAELLLDPFYRTISGFRIVVEREFLSFGHKFSDRNGNDHLNHFPADESERSPIFLQFLDCVHQLSKQYPSVFEFSSVFLIKLAQHSFSGLFGTFLYNSEKTMFAAHTHTQTFSVWSLLESTRDDFRNMLYNPNFNEVLFPACHVSRMMLFSELYTAPLFTTLNQHALTLSTDQVNDIIPFSLPLSLPTGDVEKINSNSHFGDKLGETISKPLVDRVDNIDTDGLLPVRDELQVQINNFAKSHGCNIVRSNSFNGYRQPPRSIPQTQDTNFVSRDECGWQVVRKSESDITLWVPDHASTSCHKCQSIFWVAQRRHHCRKCGKVFCGNCSNYFVPVPDQNLHENVRVCFTCFDKLDGFLSNNKMTTIYT